MELIVIIASSVTDAHGGLVAYWSSYYGFDLYLFHRSDETIEKPCQSGKYFLFFLFIFYLFLL